MDGRAITGRSTTPLKVQQANSCASAEAASSAGGLRAGPAPATSLLLTGTPADAPVRSAHLEGGELLGPIQPERGDFPQVNKNGQSCSSSRGFGSLGIGS